MCVPVIAGLTEVQVHGLREVFGLFDPEGWGAFGQFSKWP